jgi:hypothetical protein
MGLAMWKAVVISVGLAAAAQPIHEAGHAIAVRLFTGVWPRFTLLGSFSASDPISGSGAGHTGRRRYRCSPLVGSHFRLHTLAACLEAGVDRSELHDGDCYGELVCRGCTDAVRTCKRRCVRCCKVYCYIRSEPRGSLRWWRSWQSQWPPAAETRSRHERVNWVNLNR